MIAGISEADDIALLELVPELFDCLVRIEQLKLVALLYYLRTASAYALMLRMIIKILPCRQQPESLKRDSRERDASAFCF